MKRRLLIGALAALVLTVNVPAFAQSGCRIDDAIRAYEAGQFDQARQLAEACVAARGPAEQRVQAYELVAKLHLAVDDLAKAELAVTSLLGVSPDFAPGLDDPPRFTQLVQRLKRELARNVTSSVSKMSETLLEAPATIIVVTSDQIRDRGYLDLEAVLHDLPGFDISRASGPSYANVYQRGYRSDSTNRTLFLIDGVEQNDLFSNIAYISRQYPLSNINRVEVVYGPASTMYGANAFLGVISVVTKEPEDLIPEGRRTAMDLQTGAGSWNTRFFDATFAGRFKNVFFSMTGRAYLSNEFDLSGRPGWKYDGAAYGTTEAKTAYEEFLTTGFFFDGCGNLLGIGKQKCLDRARALDQSAMSEIVGGRPVGYSDLTRDWSVSGRLRVKDLEMGLQAWQQREGAASAGTDRREPGARNGNVWVPTHTSLYARYNAPISGSVMFSYFGQAKVDGLAKGSSVFSLQSYLDGGFSLNDMDNGRNALWAETRLTESSNQFRNEINVTFHPQGPFNMVGGIESRYSSIQKDYGQTSDCGPSNIFQTRRREEVQSALARGDEATFDGLLDRYLAFAFADVGSSRAGVARCATQPMPPQSASAPHFAVRDTGVFVQASYRPNPLFKVIFGGRVDHNKIDPETGFGAVFTPRLGLVYSRRGLVLKTIYAEAFKEPSNLEKYSVVSGIRDQANPNLAPERVRNLEFSAGRQSSRGSVNLSAYRASYTDTIHLAPTNKVASAEIEHFLNSLNDDDDVDLALAVSKLSEEAYQAFFVEPLSTTQYQDDGALTIVGLQADAAWKMRGADLFGNYTYTRPENQTDDGTGRVGDIASHRFNLGGSQAWRTLTASLRMNYVGARPTGIKTTVDQNPLSSIKAYAVVNAALSYRTPVHGLTAQVVLNNLFNTTYADPGVGTADGVRFASSVPQPGRSIFVRMFMKF